MPHSLPPAGTEEAVVGVGWVTAALAVAASTGGVVVRTVAVTTPCGPGWEEAMVSPKGDEAEVAERSFNSNKVAFPAPGSLQFAMQNALHLLSPSFYMCAMRVPVPLAGPATPLLCS